MIGHRLTVRGDQFLYVLGLLSDEGLTPEVDYQPAGGNELVIRPAAWDRLGSETQGEVLRFTRDGSPFAAEGVSGDVEGPPGNAGPAGASAATTAAGAAGPDEPEDGPDEPESDAEAQDGTEDPDGGPGPDSGPERPPRTGTGSGRTAWAAYAAAAGVRVTADMNRDDIIKAVERQETDR